MSQKTALKSIVTTEIPKGWEESLIGNHIELIYGDGLPERDRRSGLIPVFGSNGVTGFHDKALVKGPGIIIGRKGTVGQVTLSKGDFWPIDTTYYVKFKKDGDIFFWYYLLQVLGLSQMNSHSAVPGLNRDNVYNIVREIPLPTEQRVIAKILSDLDAKIELNHQMNKTLESIAQAIFKKWFVDFEFPEYEKVKFVDGLPENWVDTEFGEIVSCVKTQVHPGNHLFNRKYVPIECMPMKQLWLSDYKDYTEAQSSLITFEKGDILFGAMRAYFHRVNYAPFAGITRTTVFVLRPRESNWLEYALLLMNLDESVEYANAHSKGSTMPYAVWENSLEKMPCILPSEGVITEFSKIINPYFEMMNANAEMNQRLMQIRDSLLPRLMSGKIRVR